MQRSKQKSEQHEKPRTPPPIEIVAMYAKG